MAGTAGGSSDESLEIVFWWLGEDPTAAIEDELEDFLEKPRPRSRRRRIRDRRVGRSTV
jgi:hypothetical protein